MLEALPSPALSRSFEPRSPARPRTWDALVRGLREELEGEVAGGLVVAFPALRLESALARAAARLPPGGRVGLLTCLARSAFEAFTAVGHSGAGGSPCDPLPGSASALASALEDAGFVHIEADSLTLQLRFADGASALEWLRGAGRPAHPWVPPPSAADAEIAARLEEFADGAGVPLTVRLGWASATAPGSAC